MSIVELAQKQIGQITSFQKYIDAQVGSYIVRPLTAQGIGGFLFTIRDNERLELRADITDYVSEDASAFQDHIAIKPMTMTLRGFIGEAENKVDSGSVGVLGTLQDKLTTVSAYAPPFTQGAIDKAAAALSSANTALQTIDSIIKQTQNIASTLGVPLYGGTAQEQAFLTLSGMFNARQVVTVETPWGYFDNMAITGIVTEQDGKSTEISDIIVALKQMRFRATEILSPAKAGRAGQKSAATINKGRLKGTEITSQSDAPWSKEEPGNQSEVLSFIFDPNNAKGLTQISLGGQ